MRILGRFRFSIATLLMLVLTAATASAFFAEVAEHGEPPFGRGSSAWKYDAPTLGTIAIASTAVALGSLKGHTPVQTMLQAMLAYLGYLSLIWLGEAGMERPLLYWFQASFTLTVALPLLARKWVKARMPRGARRTWWKRTCEAIVFSALNMLLVVAGVLLQLLVVELGGGLLDF